MNDINLQEYTYNLPDEKIAKYPLDQRDQSKLLLCSDNQISHHTFKEIPNFLPDKSLIVFNNTKVIPARLFFQKSTGAHIEVFLLEPVLPSRVMSENMASKQEVVWSCMVGNAKKWKEDQTLTLELDNMTVTASWHDKPNQIVKLSWDKDLPFSDVVDAVGKVPLPPYINRELTDDDKPRYQTVYSKIDGAVAAPTAGLHFSDEVLDSIKEKGIIKDELTLHVSAGTFQPIKAATVEEHPMHSEQVIVTIDNVDQLINSNQVIAVGTTSMRTLESLYWYGVKLQDNPEATFDIEKLYPYVDHQSLPSFKDSLMHVKNKMLNDGANQVIGHTEIFIFPGYTFRSCDGLVTNFHLPGSTLILLVAAFIGDQWREIYQQALEHNYRFLSYGDSSLLLNPGN